MEAYIGQVICVGFSFAPVGWALCQGQVLPIQGNEALYSLIGTTFGGNGQTTFGLPDLQGRTALGMGAQPGGTSYAIGQQGGVESVTLSVNQIPSHGHPANARSAGTGIDPTNSVIAGGQSIFASASETETMAANALSNAGGSQPHENRQPYLTLNWIICLNGIYPTQQ
jgi:microcystin-dependent protein